MIIDFHTHVFPDDIAERTVSATLKRSGISSSTDGTIQGLLNSMRNARIDISVVSRITTRTDLVEPNNQWLLSLAQHGIAPFATMLPELKDKVGYIKRLKKQGFKGIKLHPDYQGFFVDDRRMYPFYEEAQTEGVPILFHAGMDRGLPPPLHSTPKRLLKIHNEFPLLKMVAAHMGGEKGYRETEDLLLGKDIYLDTSFVLRLVPLKILERFFKKHPIERILFGTDSPWKDQKEELEFLFSLTFLTDKDKEILTSTNALQLLGN
ncbi:amidohydrolase family protein [Thermodesulfobacteriota bacterium]